MLPAAAPPLDDENLLSEILLRLPPQPSSLPRASAVCKRWLGLVNDRGFIRRLRRHHRRNPPLLGVFRKHGRRILFIPTMDPPNRVPHRTFSARIGCGPGDGDRFRLLGCRHGLVLIFHSSGGQFLVWDPVTGDQRRAAAPPGLDMLEAPVEGTVIRAAGDADHFKVVLVGYTPEQNPRPIIFSYSSETAVWNTLISTPVPGGAMEYARMPAVLVGNSLYWLFSGSWSVILEVDLDMQSLAVTLVPRDVFSEGRHCNHLMVMRAGGGLGVLSLSTDYTAQLWRRSTNCDGTASWLLRRSVDLGTLLRLNSQENITRYITVTAYAEENNVAFFCTHSGIFMVQLDSLQFSKIVQFIPGFLYYPLESVYAAETCIRGERDGADQDMPVTG